MDKIIQLFEHFNHQNYIGEAISQKEHALQCAYFAQRLGHSDDVILASLFHDIGHVVLQSPQPQMAELGVINHEWIGAIAAIEAGLPKKVGRLIGLHVEAKRYLAAKKPQYAKRLSPASKGTLNFQGGPMTKSECQYFESMPLYKEALQVRTHDEKGKLTDLNYPAFDTYLPLIEKHLDTTITSKTDIIFYQTNDSLPKRLPPNHLALSYDCSIFDEHIMLDNCLSEATPSEESSMRLEERCQLMKESVIVTYHLVASTFAQDNISKNFND